MEKITALVQTYNAAQHLQRVLAALKGFDEMLVVDMESTDDTVEIARKAGATVMVVPRGDNHVVEAYREFAIRSAANPWVLVVDADEIVTPQLRQYLYDRVNADPAPVAVEIPFKNYFMGKFMRCLYPDYHPRFFHRDHVKWATSIHSRPQLSCPVERIPASRQDLAFVHLANESVSQTLRKMNLYTDNELPRRRKRYRRYKLWFDPTFVFFRTWILKGSIRQGWPGFIKAVMNAQYRFTLLAKLEEERQAMRTNKDIDPYL